MTDRRGSVFVEDAPIARAPTRAPEAPVSAGDVVGAHWTLGRQDFAGADRQAEDDAYGPIVKALAEKRAHGWFGADATRYIMVGAARPINTTNVWQDVIAERARDPAFMKDIPAKNAEEFAAWVKRRELGKRRTAQDVVSRQSGVGQGAIGFATDIGTGLLDPVNLMTLPLGGGVAGSTKTLMGVMAREALTNATVEAIELPTIARNRAGFGEDMSATDMAADVGMAAIGGAAFGAGGKAAVAAGKAIAGSAAGKAVGRSIAPVALRLADVGRATDGDVARAFSDAVPAEIRNPDEQAALHVVQRQADIDATNPFTSTAAGMDAHAETLTATMERILAVDAPDAVSAPRGPAPIMARPTPNLSAERVISFVMHDLEGGATVVRYGDVDGGTTKYGIAAKFNPSVDVANLTAEQAAGIAKRKYWFAALDGADPRAAAVAFDAGYIGGTKLGKRILRDSGGDPDRALALYRGYLDNLAATNPAKAKYRAGWARRVDKLARFVGGSEDRVAIRPEAFADDAGMALAQHDLDHADLEAQLAASERARAEAPEFDGPPDRTPIVLEGSGIVEQEPAGATDVAPVEDARAIPEGAAAAPARVDPATQLAVRSYVTETRGSLAVPKLAKALEVSEDEARAALDVLAGDPRAGLVRTRAKVVKGQAVEGRLMRRPVRRGPVDLHRFIADLGGLADDEGHDLIDGRGLQRFVPGSGPLIRKTGLSLDRAREYAAEAGYFPDRSPDDAIGETTTDDFLQLLQDADRAPVYTIADQLAAMDRDAARDASEARQLIDGYVDQLASEQGFDLGRDGRRRAVRHVEENGLTEQQAIERVVNEDLAEALDDARMEAEKDRYDLLADEIERTLAGDDLRSAPRDDGYGLDPRHPGQGEPGAFELRGAAKDEREALGLSGAVDADPSAARALDDPSGAGAVAIVDSLDHDIRATVAQDAAGDDGLGPSSVLTFVSPKGPPGVSVINDEGHLAIAVFRDKDGKAQGAVQMPISDEAREIHNEVLAYVRPDFRRRGIATQLYDALREAGHEVDELSGTGDLTPNGAAFVNDRRRAALDHGDAIDPAIAERQRQEAGLKAASPMRAAVDQEGTIGSPLFDAVEQGGFRLDEEAPERTIDDILKEVDDDEAAIKAARDCL